jgi:transposase
MAATVTPSRFIGCDVGKAAIVIHDADRQKTWEIKNTPKAAAAFAAKLDPSCLVVCEATGGYEAVLLAALVANDIPTHRADARKVKAFIRSFGTLGKTDAIDAKALARYAQERGPVLSRWRAPDPVRLKLQALVLARQDLVADHVAYLNRSQAPGYVPDVHLRIAKTLEKNIERLEAQIDQLLKSSQTLVQAAKILRAIPSFGPVVTASLLAVMPELGQLDRRTAASLAGLAPHPRQSGASEGYRATRGGRPTAKRVLFMAAFSAAKWHPDLKLFYERLVNAGKKPLVAIVAVMRKLVVIANAKLRDAFASSALPQVS